jgi:hypothetical protein
MGWKCLCGTQSLTGQQSIPTMIDTWANIQQRWRENLSTAEKFDLEPLCPPQIPHGMPWARIIPIILLTKYLCFGPRGYIKVRILETSPHLILPFSYLNRSLSNVHNYIRSELLTAMKLSMLVFWVETPCGLAVSQWFNISNVYGCEWWNATNLGFQIRGPRTFLVIRSLPVWWKVVTWYQKTRFVNVISIW